MNDVVPPTGSPVRGAPSVRLKRSLSALKPVLSLGALLAGVTAFAQTQQALPEFELESLTLNPGGTGSLLLGTGETMQRESFRFSLTGHYEHNPLVSYLNGTREGSVVGHRVTSHLAAAYGLTDRLELSLQVPVLLTQRGDPLSGLQHPAEGMTLGTPYLGVRLGLLQQHQNHGVDLALGLNAGLPLGSADALARDSTLRAIPSVMVGRAFGKVRAGVEAGMLVRASTLVSNTEVNDSLRLGAVVSTTGQRVRGELDVLGHIPLNGTAPSSLEALAGARLPLSSALEAYAMAGVGVGQAPGTPNFRGLVGMSYAYGGKPSDRPPPPPPPAPGCMVEGSPDGDCDKVADAKDICPTVVGRPEFQGCPDADMDRDDLLNSKDMCPTVPGPKEFQGCPDTDKDGIQDSEDKCPTLPGDKAFQGCPDMDKDGIQNSEDKCPTLPGEKRFQGCPDSDKDDIQDSEDKCPTLPGPLETQGCPKPTGERGELKFEPVHFVTGKAVIQEKSFGMLEGVAKLLNENPQYAKIWIEGHTDDQGSEAKNLTLSQLRAETVRDHLIKTGHVNAERLEAQGFGEQFSVASNETEAGRSINRRVEFFTRPREVLTRSSPSPTKTPASPSKPRGAAPKARRAPTPPRNTQQR